MYICDTCGKKHDNYKHYRKNMCKDCYNKKQKRIMRNRASTLEGYLKQTITSNKNNIRKNPACSDISDLNVETLLELWDKQDGKCAISGIPMTYGYSNEGHMKNPYNCSVDRIDNSIGYIKSNMWLVCTAVNYFKMTHDLQTVFNISKSIVENNNINTISF